MAKAPVVAVNVAEVRPAVTVTDAGTVNVAFVLPNVTAAFPAGAAFVSVTVQFVDEFGPILGGLQTRDDTSTDAVRLMVAPLELLLYVAAIVEL